MLYEFLLVFDSAKPIIKLHNKKLINKMILNSSWLKYFLIDISRAGYLVLSKINENHSLAQMNIEL